jgi:hypothetical protein
MQVQFLSALGMSLPALPCWQSVENIQIGHKFSQILTNEPHILTVKPYISLCKLILFRLCWNLPGNT